MTRSHQVLAVMYCSVMPATTTMTIDGSGDKTVDGGPGTDSLTISYGSVTGINDFTIDVSKRIYITD
jgi:hypothetical protein